jgi:hypothetical protein
MDERQHALAVRPALQQEVGFGVVRNHDLGLSLGSVCFLRGFPSLTWRFLAGFILRDPHPAYGHLLPLDAGEGPRVVGFVTCAIPSSGLRPPSPGHPGEGARWVGFVSWGIPSSGLWQPSPGHPGEGARALGFVTCVIPSSGLRPPSPGHPGEGARAMGFVTCVIPSSGLRPPSPGHPGEGARAFVSCVRFRRRSAAMSSRCRASRSVS